MKTTIIIATIFASLSATAAIQCSGDGINLQIDTAAKTLKVFGRYTGSIYNLKGSGEDLFGSSNNGNFKSLRVATGEGVVDITNKSGRIENFSVSCN